MYNIRTDRHASMAGMVKHCAILRVRLVALDEKSYYLSRRGRLNVWMVMHCAILRAG